MGWTEDSIPRHARGKQEMRTLAVSTFSALEAAEFTDLIAQLRVRVFDRGPATLFDVDQVEDGWQWSFKPMVELLLRHILEVTADTSRTSMQRQREILEAMELVGF